MIQSYTPSTSRQQSTNTLHTVHGQRVARKQELRQRGIPVTKPSYVWRVTPSVIPIPDWARKEAVKGLSYDPYYVWLRKSAAWLLAKFDREDFGRPHVVRFEYRQCQICKSVLLGELAKARRMLDESCVTGNQLPCGPDCLARHWRGKA